MKNAALFLALVSIPLLNLSAQHYDTLRVSIARNAPGAYNTSVNLCTNTIVLNNDFKWDLKSYSITLNKQLEVQTVIEGPDKLEETSRLTASEEQLVQQIKKLCFELRPNKSFEGNELTLQLNLENIRNKVWTITEEMPEFTHSDYSSFLDYISKNIDREITDRVGLGGTVYVEFLVTYEGKIDDVKVTRSLHPKLDMEAIRVIKNSPLWKSGKQGGTSTNVRLMYPIRFK